MRGFFCAKLVLLAAASALFTTGLRAELINFWPAYVVEENSVHGRPDFGASMGPIFADIRLQDRKILSIRPLWTRFSYENTDSSHWHVLYPVANWYERPGVSYGHVLNLIRYRHQEETSMVQFEVFPFFFYRDGDQVPKRTLALWPVAGVIHNRLFRDEIAFAAWPLLVRTRKGDETRVHFPYPFLRYHYGPHSSGFGIWPLFGKFQRENDYANWWALWPVLYSYKDKLDREQPRVRLGAWPFYHHESDAGMHSHNWVWPFFGYTREYDPRPVYSENRYFFPFLVQGRGDEKYINRWLPLFSDESSPGYSKQWYLWPLLKREKRQDGAVVRDITTLLYFFARHEVQDLGDTKARLGTVWPLFSFWDDGRGRSQLQALDPLTIFFPSNQVIKQNWSPLFAVYRWDQRGDNRRHSLLWDLITLELDPEQGNRFTFGPLLDWKTGGSGIEWSLLKGLLGSSLDAAGERRLQLFWSRL